MDSQLAGLRADQSNRSIELDALVTGRFQALAEQLSAEFRDRNQADAAVRQELQVVMSDRLSRMEDRMTGLERSLASSIAGLQETNSKGLEKIRSTVDEQLQGTLEKRLGESFKLVSLRLEEVQRGLGEMRSLATDVDGLKRVLTNVKSRGTWGEVQLGRQLEDLLTKSQYEENVAVNPGSLERVEYAVILPGKSDERPLYLPIDSKFPTASYDRLVDAQEKGEREDVKASVAALERDLRAQAQMISSKYIKVPHTTDFAIMYLPTEGLFAEAIRIPGFTGQMQADYRVMITGPTTLASMLTSLQLGFRTLAIEQRTSEVWGVLASAKNEFQKYGQVWDKLARQLKTAQNTVEEAGRRTRAVERKLREVESP